MENKYLFSILLFTVTFLATFIALYFVGRDEKDYHKKNTITYIVTYILFVISALGLSSFFSQEDFIYNLNILEPITIFTMSALIFLFYSWNKTKKIAYVSVILGACTLYLFIPDTYNIFIDSEQYLFSKLTIIVSFFVLSIFYKFINGLEGIMASQTFFIGIGIYLLAILSAAPMLLGYIGLALAGIYIAFYTFNSYPARLHINNAGASSLGFIVAWLLIKTAEESSLSCSLLFSMYFIMEATLAYAKKFTLSEKYKNIYSNTFSYQANTKGLSAKVVDTSVMKILILMTIFGCLQVYMPNSFSMPIFAAFIMIWFLNKLSNWDVPRQTLKEMNKSFVEDMKENIDEVRRMINKD